MAGPFDALKQSIDPFARAYMDAYGVGRGAPKIDDYLISNGFGGAAWKGGTDFYGDLARYRESFTRAQSAASTARARRQVRPADYQPDLFDALAQRWQNEEFERLASDSTRARFFSRPSGLGGAR